MPKPEPPTWLETVVKAVLVAIGPLGGSAVVVLDDARARAAAKAGEVVEDIIRITGEPTLAQRLQGDAVLEALFVKAVEAAVRSGLAAKRRLLARVVADAVVDDAKFDESLLIATALDELDVPHIRTLNSLANEWAVKQARPDNSALWGTSDVWRETPEPIKAVLVRSGTAMPQTTLRRGKSKPNRQEGISEFGLRVLQRLIDEGYAEDA